MSLKNLFQQFLNEKRFIQNVSQHTICFYEQSAKSFNLQEPITKSQLTERVASMRQAGKSAGCVNACIRGINPFLTWINENGFLAESLKVKQLRVKQRMMRTFSDAELGSLVSHKLKDFYEKPLDLDKQFSRNAEKSC